jgi:hypothetical protein
MRCKLPRSLAVALVWFSILAGSVCVCLGVWYGGALLELSTRLRSHLMVPAFFFGFYLFAKIGGRILFPAAVALDRAVPMPEQTKRQRLWRVGQEIKAWVDGMTVGLLAIGGATVVGMLVHRLGFGTWATVAIIVPVWLLGIIVAVRMNAWTTRKLERYQPPSETETLLKTFD